MLLSWYVVLHPRPESLVDFLRIPPKVCCSYFISFFLNILRIPPKVVVITHP